MLTAFFKYSKFPSLVMSTSLQGSFPSILAVNAAYITMFGYSEAELLGQTPKIFHDSELLKKVTDGNGGEGESLCQHKDGTPFWIYWSIFPIKDDAGNTLYIGGIFFDITEKKYLDKMYRDLDGQFLSLVQNIPGMIYRCALDENWTIEFMSDYIHNLSGYPVSDFIDNKVRSYASIIHPDDVEIVERVVNDAVAQKKPYTIEYRIIHADGSIRYVYERGQATFDAEGDEVDHLDGVITDITERKVAEEQILQLAFYDPLTHLPNRRLLMDRLNLIQFDSERTKEYGALLFIDLDNFKELNDTRGHDCGDILLREVALRLKHSIRQGDTVARLGGDEFIIILRGLNSDINIAKEESQTIGHKILSAMNRPYHLDEFTYTISTSIGTTLINGRQYTGEDLIKQADMAMYMAKSSGRNTLRFFNR